MRKLVRLLLALACAVTLLSSAAAQPPGRKADTNPDKEKVKDYSNSPIVLKMMAFNKNKDGKLTRDEVTDERLHRLFDQADANKDGVVTREELQALAAKLEAESGPGGERGGPGGPGRKGPGGFGGPPRPGQIMPPFLQERLQLTADQKKQLAELQKEVDGKLETILTDQQKQQLKELRERGPGGFGPPGGKGPPPPPERQEQIRGESDAAPILLRISESRRTL